MKKSKFLKKSLAMLLALMLVVAMIPLSASAAAPVMRQVDVTAGGQVVQLVPGEGANTLEGEISNLSQDIRLTVLAGNGNTVYYTDMTSSATTDEVAVNNGDGTWTIDIAAADVADFVNSEGQVQVNFSVADSEKPATRISYTVLLTRVYVSTDTSITNFTINSNTQVQLGETVIQENDIYFTVPYDAAMIAQNSFTVRELELASASARVQFSRADGTNGENWTYYYSTEVTTEKVITDGLTTDTGVAVQIMNGDRLEITNNGRTHTYNIHITPASGFTSFTTEEGLDAVMFTDTGDIAVLLPWGYTDGKDSVTVTPVFALDYDRAWATTTSDAEVVSGESTLTISSDDVINGNTPSTTRNFHSFGDDGTPVDWETRKAEATSFNAFMHNVEYYGGAGNKGETYGYQLVVNYSEEASRTYDIYFFETRLNNDATITDLTIGSETAVIDQEAKTIDITVPMGTVLTALNNGTSHVAMTMEASNNATITMPMQQNAISITENDTTRAPYVDYTVSGVINGTNSVQISVTSEDGLTQNFYTLNVTVADEFVKPAITNMTLQSLDGTNYEGNITTAVDGMNVVQFELPYEIYDEALLNGWKLFYTKTVGSTITFDSNGQTPGGAVAMPRSGDELTGGEVYLPDIDDEVRADVAIDLHVSGEDLSAESTSYYIEITRAAGKEVSELTDFSLYGLPDYANLDSGLYDDLYASADVGDRFSYAGEIDQVNDTVAVSVPWSVYQQWNGVPKTFTAILAAAEASNARVYVLKDNAAGDLKLVDNDRADALSAADPGSTAINGTIYDGSTIVVLSEKTWVTIEELNLSKPDGSGDIDGWTALKTNVPSNPDLGFFTEYTVDFASADPATGYELSDLRLVDGTGWTAPLSITTLSDNGVIEGAIPYALTSDIDDPKTWNPVYLEYNTSPYAFVMGADNATGRPATDAFGVPTAGTDRNGVFVDIADYLALYDNNYDLALEAYYTDGNPFFLIDRNGDVYIYNCTNPSAGPILVSGDLTLSNCLQDTLLVSDEDGSDYQRYTVDLTVNRANNGTEVTSFYFEEYPTRKGVIDDTNKTITVTLPYGTEYTYLTPNYTVSEGAIVTIDDPELQGKPLFPGYTDVNFSTSRKMTVLAENESDSTEYTIRVQIEERFSDVSPDDWFYDNVMGAAANGYISGMGDGTFNPKGATTRAQFASMIAKAMGYDDSLAGETRFKDVPADQWYAGAITYCFDNDIISGYDDGTFQPDKTITRQEAASILKNAFNLTGNSGEKFPDDSAIAGWAKENVYAVKHSGLMKGDADTGNFRPTSTIIRAEAASILMNANRAGLIK